MRLLKTCGYGGELAARGEVGCAELQVVERGSGGVGGVGAVVAKREKREPETLLGRLLR